MNRMMLPPDWIIEKMLKPAGLPEDLLNELTPDLMVGVRGNLPLYDKNSVEKFIEKNRPSLTNAKSFTKAEDFNVVDFASSQSLERIAGDTNIAALVAALNAQTHAIGSLVATLAPKMPELVGTDYLALRLGCTPQWVAKMAERGEIPKHCIAPKVSGGRIWKFYREKLDAWLRDREQG